MLFRLLKMVRTLPYKQSQSRLGRVYWPERNYLWQLLLYLDGKMAAQAPSCSHHAYLETEFLLLLMSVNVSNI